MDTKTTLSQIYNTLSTIETKGENTLKMAACLDALGQVLNTMNTDEAAPEVATAE